MYVHTALTAIAALALTGVVTAGEPGPTTSIHVGYFNNTGWGTVDYQGSYESYITVTQAPQDGTMFPTLIEVDLAGLLLDNGFNAFTEVRTIDTGSNQYGENSPGADMDLLGLLNLDPALDVSFDYDGPNTVHQSEDSPTLQMRVDSIDAQSGASDSNAYTYVSLGDQGVLTASITGWATGGDGDGGSDGGAGPITPSLRTAGSAPALQLTESGNGESYDLYVTATTIPAPGALAVLGAAGAMLGRRRRRRA